MTNEELAEELNYDELYINNKRIMYKICRKYVTPRYTIEDLMQEGYFCIVAGVKAYNGNKTHKFITYLTRALSWHCIRLMRQDTNSKDMSILDSPMSNDDSSGVTLVNTLQDPNAIDGQDNLEQQDIKQILRAAIDRLADPQADIINKRYFNNMTLVSISELYNITSQKVLNIERVALKELRRDNVLRHQIKDYTTPFYNTVSVQAFNNSHTSSTEFAVLLREKLGLV